MKATIKKTNLTPEQIELNNEKKELKKLAKIIEKAPSKKELKQVSKIETMEEIKKVSITNDLISFNFEEYLNNKNLIKQLQQKNNILISDIFKEISILMVNFKKELDSNITNYKHIEFSKKSLIIILRNKLENKLNKELFNIYAVVLDYMTYNLTIQLNLVSYSQLKSIIKAYKLQLDNNVYFKDITKNAIAKLKTKEDYIAFLKNISAINATIKKDKLIEEYLSNNKKDTSKKVA